ncbi:hypothetical protein HZB88_01145 [archaeon]|nr:hypothetical protein [archaeon]
MTLFSIFKTRKKQKLSLIELDTWLAKNIEINLADEFAIIKKSIMLLRASIENLNKFNIDSQKTSEKLKTIVQDHRTAYISALKSFLNKIELPETFGAERVLQFALSLDVSLSEFNKKTIKNYHALKSIIGKETEDMLLSLRALSKTAALLKEQAKKLEILEHIHADIKEINCIREAKDSVKKLEEENRFVLEKEKSLNSEIESLKKSSLFKEYETLKIKREALQEKLKEIESKIRNTVSALSRPLKKLAKELPSHSSLIAMYLEEPVKALHEDKSLELHSILSKLEIKGTAQGLLDSFNPENIQKEYKEAIHNLSQTDKALKENKFEEELQNLLGKLKEIITQINANNAKIQKVCSATTDELTKRIEQNLKRLGKEIQIYNT